MRGRRRVHGVDRGIGSRWILASIRLWRCDIRRIVGLTDFKFFFAVPPLGRRLRPESEWRGPTSAANTRAGQQNRENPVQHRAPSSLAYPLVRLMCPSLFHPVRPAGDKRPEPGNRAGAWPQGKRLDSQPIARTTAWEQWRADAGLEAGSTTLRPDGPFLLPGRFDRAPDRRDGAAQKLRPLRIDSSAASVEPAHLFPGKTGKPSRSPRNVRKRAAPRSAGKIFSRRSAP